MGANYSIGVPIEITGDSGRIAQQIAGFIKKAQTEASKNDISVGVSIKEDALIKIGEAIRQLDAETIAIKINDADAIKKINSLKNEYEQLIAIVNNTKATKGAMDTKALDQWNTKLLESMKVVSKYNSSKNDSKNSSVLNSFILDMQEYISLGGDFKKLSKEIQDAYTGIGKNKQSNMWINPDMFKDFNAQTDNSIKNLEIFQKELLKIKNIIDSKIGNISVDWANAFIGDGGKGSGKGNGKGSGSGNGNGSGGGNGSGNGTGSGDAEALGSISEEISQAISTLTKSLEELNGDISNLANESDKIKTLSDSVAQFSKTLSEVKISSETIDNFENIKKAIIGLQDVVNGFKVDSDSFKNNDILQGILQQIKSTFSEAVSEINSTSALKSESKSKPIVQSPSEVKNIEPVVKAEIKEGTTKGITESAPAVEKVIKETVAKAVSEGMVAGIEVGITKQKTTTAITEPTKDFTLSSDEWTNVFEEINDDIQDYYVSKTRLKNYYEKDLKSANYDELSKANQALYDDVESLLDYIDGLKEQYESMKITLKNGEEILVDSLESMVFIGEGKYSKVASVSGTYTQEHLGDVYYDKVDESLQTKAILLEEIISKISEITSSGEYFDSGIRNQSVEDMAESLNISVEKATQLQNIYKEIYEIGETVWKNVGSSGYYDFSQNPELENRLQLLRETALKIYKDLGNDVSGELNTLITKIKHAGEMINSPYDDTQDIDLINQFNQYASRTISSPASAYDEKLTQLNQYIQNTFSSLSKSNQDIISKVLFGEDGNIVSETKMLNEIIKLYKNIENAKNSGKITGEEYNKQIELLYRRISKGQAFGILPNKDSNIIKKLPEELKNSSVFSNYSKVDVWGKNISEEMSTKIENLRLAVRSFQAFSKDAGGEKYLKGLQYYDKLENAAQKFKTPLDVVKLNEEQELTIEQLYQQIDLYKQQEAELDNILQKTDNIRTSLSQLFQEKLFSQLGEKRFGFVDELNAYKDSLNANIDTIMQRISTISEANKNNFIKSMIGSDNTEAFIKTMPSELSTYLSEEIYGGLETSSLSATEALDMFNKKAEELGFIFDKDTQKWNSLNNNIHTPQDFSGLSLDIKSATATGIIEGVTEGIANASEIIQSGFQTAVSTGVKAGIEASVTIPVTTPSSIAIPQSESVVSEEVIAEANTIATQIEETTQAATETGIVEGIHTGMQEEVPIVEETIATATSTGSTEGITTGIAKGANDVVPALEAEIANAVATGVSEGMTKSTETLAIKNELNIVQRAYAKYKEEVNSFNTYSEETLSIYNQLVPLLQKASIMSSKMDAYNRINKEWESGVSATDKEHDSFAKSLPSSEQDIRDYINKMLFHPGSSGVSVEKRNIFDSIFAEFSVFENDYDSINQNAFNPYKSKISKEKMLKFSKIANDFRAQLIDIEQNYYPLINQISAAITDFVKSLQSNRFYVENDSINYIVDNMKDIDIDTVLRKLFHDGQYQYDGVKDSIKAHTYKRDIDIEDVKNIAIPYSTQEFNAFSFINPEDIKNATELDSIVSKLLQETGVLSDAMEENRQKWLNSNESNADEYYNKYMNIEEQLRENHKKLYAYTELQKELTVFVMLKLTNKHNQNLLKQNR